VSRRILVAVDFGELTQRTLAYVTSLTGDGDKLDLLHVLVGRPSSLGLGFPAARELVDSLIDQERQWSVTKLEELMAQIPEHLRGQTLLHEGPPAEVIVETAAEGGHELIAVATHGRTGLEHMLIGSVAERVVRLAGVPVVVVR
jgi:universal stress protein A